MTDAPGAAPRVAVLPSPELESRPLLLVWKLLTTVWHPIQFAGIVVLVLIFVLLEYESLRDRFIRVAGATDIRSATLALNDAGDRLSRYFVSQFAINFGFGLAIWMSLSLLRLPQALLCGILAGVMRFVPYVGVAIAALFAAALALAVDPGWSLALSGLGVFIVLDIVVGQLVELNHRVPASCGASHERAWCPQVLLGNATALTLPQKFQQQAALSGNSQEIIAHTQPSGSRTETSQSR
jgi:hypothetical protein